MEDFKFRLPVPPYSTTKCENHFFRLGDIITNDRLKHICAPQLAIKEQCFSGKKANRNMDFTQFARTFLFLCCPENKQICNVHFFGAQPFSKFSDGSVATFLDSTANSREASV